MDEKLTNIRSQLKIAGKRWRIILMVFTGIFGLVSIGTLVATPLYEGSVRIIIERVESDNLSGNSRYQPKDPEFEKTQFQLIQSHAVARRVVDMLNLDEGRGALDELNKTSWLNSIRKHLGDWISDFSEQTKSDSEETAMDEQPGWSEIDRIAERISLNVRVRPVEGSNITEINYTSPDPDFAAMAANTYVRAYLEETLDMKMEATRRNLEWMTQKAETERLKMQATEKKLQVYMEEHDLVTLENRVTIIPEKLAQLGRDLVRAETKTKESKLLYDKVQGVAGNMDAAETVLSISEGSSLDVLRAQILQAEQSNMELSSKYGSKHPVMIKARGDLGVLKKKRRQEINRLIKKVKNQYELALSNEKSIRSQLDETKIDALELNEKYVEYSALKQEIETNSQLYNALLTKIKDQSITGETRPVNLWVVENAKVPLEPVRPMVALNLIIGLMLGIFCGTACAFLVDHLDNRVKSSAGVYEKLGVSVLGTVSMNKNSEKMSEIVLAEPRSEFAESYNTLRTTLLLSAPAAPPKRILVSSSIAGEGKTTTAVNLAMTMAKAGSRVVLIDADLRKPSIHKIFKLRNRAGLSSHLAGVPGNSILSKSPHPNLVIMPAGPIPPNPYELLNSSKMASLLENLSADFDVIICDTPPILSVADSRVLSRIFDGMIMVARANKTTFPMAQESIKLLRGVNTTIFGMLINATQLRDQEDYYRYYSSYLDETEKPDNVSLRSRLGTVSTRDS